MVDCLQDLLYPEGALVSCKVAVRILKRGDKFLVQGRKTSVLCSTFEQAWKESIPYFAARKW